MKKALVLSAVLLMMGGILAAQDEGLTPAEIDMMEASFSPPERMSFSEAPAESPNWYGDERFWISGQAAANCSPVTSTTEYSQSFGYYHGTSGSTTFWNCHIPAPSGTRIVGFEVETSDTDATDDICAYFWRFDVFSTTNETLGSGCTSGTGQTSIYVTGLDHTILNHWDVYTIRIVANSGTSSNRFRTLLYSAYRQISPAPGSSSFPDVGTGFWAFREIEALADSGITTGYPDGTFRPLEPVTRAQMATFLARALGLHWRD